MPLEIVNWVEIPVVDVDRARIFYESVFEFTIVDLEVGRETYPCFPNKNEQGFCGALVKYSFTKPGKEGPLVYLNSYNDMDAIISRIKLAGGKILKEKQEIAPGFGFFAVFEDAEGNMLALQGE